MQQNATLAEVLLSANGTLSEIQRRGVKRDDRLTAGVSYVSCTESCQERCNLPPLSHPVYRPNPPKNLHPPTNYKETVDMVVQSDVVGVILPTQEENVMKCYLLDEQHRQNTIQENAGKIKLIKGLQDLNGSIDDHTFICTHYKWTGNQENKKDSKLLLQPCLHNDQISSSDVQIGILVKKGIGGTCPLRSAMKMMKHEGSWLTRLLGSNVTTRQPYQRPPKYKKREPQNNTQQQQQQQQLQNTNQQVQQYELPLKQLPYKLVSTVNQVQCYPLQVLKAGTPVFDETRFNDLIDLIILEKNSKKLQSIKNEEEEEEDAEEDLQNLEQSNKFGDKNNNKINNNIKIAKLLSNNEIETSKDDHFVDVQRDDDLVKCGRDLIDAITNGLIHKQNQNTNQHLQDEHNFDDFVKTQHFDHLKNQENITVCEENVYKNNFLVPGQSTQNQLNDNNQNCQNKLKKGKTISINEIVYNHNSKILGSKQQFSPKNQDQSNQYSKVLNQSNSSMPQDEDEDGEELHAFQINNTKDYIQDNELEIQQDNNQNLANNELQIKKSSKDDSEFLNIKDEFKVESQILQEAADLMNEEEIEDEELEADASNVRSMQGSALGRPTRLSFYSYSCRLEMYVSKNLWKTLSDEDKHILHGLIIAIEIQAQHLYHEWNVQRVKNFTAQCLKDIGVTPPASSQPSPSLPHINGVPPKQNIASSENDEKNGLLNNFESLKEDQRLSTDSTTSSTTVANLQLQNNEVLEVSSTTGALIEPFVKGVACSVAMSRMSDFPWPYYFIDTRDSFAHELVGIRTKVKRGGREFLKTAFYFSAASLPENYHEVISCCSEMQLCGDHAYKTPSFELLPDNQQTKQEFLDDQNYEHPQIHKSLQDRKFSGTNDMKEENLSREVFRYSVIPRYQRDSGRDQNLNSLQSLTGAESREEIVEERIDDFYADDLKNLFSTGVVTYTDVFSDDELCRIEKGADDVDVLARKGGLPETCYHQSASKNGHVKRTKFFFGARYLWTREQLSELSAKIAGGVRVDVPSPPSWMPKLVESPLVDVDILEQNFVDSWALNLYHDGSEGLGSHFDDPDRFCQPIVSLRLFSDCRLAFGNHLYGYTNCGFFIPMPRGAVTIMDKKGYAANGMKHCIRPHDMTGKSAALILRKINPYAMQQAKLLQFEEVLQRFQTLDLNRVVPLKQDVSDQSHMLLLGSKGNRSSAADEAGPDRILKSLLNDMVTRIERMEDKVERAVRKVMDRMISKLERKDLVCDEKREVKRVMQMMISCVERSETQLPRNKKRSAQPLLAKSFNSKSLENNPYTQYLNNLNMLNILRQQELLNLPKQFGKEDGLFFVQLKVMQLLWQLLGFKDFQIEKEYHDTMDELEDSNQTCVQMGSSSLRLFVPQDVIQVQDVSVAPYKLVTLPNGNKKPAKNNTNLIPTKFLMMPQFLEMVFKMQAHISPSTPQQQILSQLTSLLLCLHESPSDFNSVADPVEEGDGDDEYNPLNDVQFQIDQNKRQKLDLSDVDEVEEIGMSDWFHKSKKQKIGHSRYDQVKLNGFDNKGDEAVMRKRKREGAGQPAVCSTCESIIQDELKWLCNGGCKRNFHNSCCKPFCSKPQQVCQQCMDPRSEVCFSCGKPPSQVSLLLRCSVGSCGRVYHWECIENHPFARTNIKGTFKCPLHYCKSCGLSGDGIPMIQCLRCPNGYHWRCRPFDATVITKKLLLCPNHNI